LKLHIPLNPINAADMVFDRLANFIEAAMEEDKQFVVFPYHLSSYNLVNELPPLVDDVETLPDEVKDWLQYFPEAKPRRCGGDIYTPVLIGLSMHFPKFIKKLSPWRKEKKYGLWPSSLQSKKLVSLGWLLFSTNLMDTDILKVAILPYLYDVPVGLQWKMIHLGTQGKVKLEDQIKALHIYVDADASTWPNLCYWHYTLASQVKTTISPSASA